MELLCNQNDISIPQLALKRKLKPHQHRYLVVKLLNHHISIKIHTLHSNSKPLWRLRENRALVHALFL